jgi:hypothetical protein
MLVPNYSQQEDVIPVHGIYSFQLPEIECPGPGMEWRTPVYNFGTPDISTFV